MRRSLLVAVNDDIIVQVLLLLDTLSIPLRFLLILLVVFVLVGGAWERMNKMELETKDIFWSKVPRDYFFWKKSKTVIWAGS